MKTTIPEHILTESEAKAIIWVAASSAAEAEAGWDSWKRWLSYHLDADVRGLLFVDTVMAFEHLDKVEDDRTDLDFAFGVPNTYENRLAMIDAAEVEVNWAVNNLFAAVEYEVQYGMTVAA